MNKGKVYLIGAGPGDVGLMTLKGKHIIEIADAIVYDRLANPRLLNFARNDAEFIYVGKTPDHHTLKQPEINELLAKLAKEGKTVARLKGGDPFVFGRGGEEGERLRQEDLPFEVIPGITSAIAVPAYAGIPVTHRSLTSTFTVITGHEDPTKDDSQINWKRLAEDPGTLIFLMGVGRLSQIVEALVSNGKSAQTPIALIRWGTRPEQLVVTGTLENIENEVSRAGLTSPAIIIIGDVVTMRDTLTWFEDKPLFGKRILVTRAREQASVLSEQIEALGGEALEAPMISVREPENKTPLQDAIQTIESYDWIIFTSVNGVKFFFDEMKQLKRDIRALGQTKICAIGPKTKALLEDKGLFVEAMPEVFRAEAVAELLKEKMDTPGKILLPRSNLGREVLVSELQKLGHSVNDVVSYETVRSDFPGTSLKEYLKEKTIQIITFTSSSTVKNFMDLIDHDLSLVQGVTIASIGPITSETAQKLGLTVDIEAETYTISGLIDAIIMAVKTAGK